MVCQLVLNVENVSNLLWYLVNGVVFHILFDGLSGSFLLVPLIVDQYQVLDNRFNTHHAVPYVVGIIEIVAMAPACFFAYRAIKQGLPSRYPLELLVALLHAFGMVMFCAVRTTCAFGPYQTTG